MTSYQKLSKKEKKKIDSQARRNWNGVNPVSKIVQPKKGGAYNRSKEKRKFVDDFT